MRVRVWVGAMLLIAMLVPGTAFAQDEPNTTCRIDATAAQAALVAKVDCLQLQPEVYGEMDGVVTVTLQYQTPAGWVDAAKETCTDTSTQGVLNLVCSASSPDAAGKDVRGLVDLDQPQDWIPAVAQPTYTGGRPISDPLAEDSCDLNETAEPSDLTAPDAPWADLCAVTMDSELDEEGDLAAVAVTTYVSGWLQERAPTSAWSTSLSVEGGCRHTLTVEDSGVTGEASVRVHSGCDYEPGECTGISKIITDTLGGVCASSGTFGLEETTELPADAVEFSGDHLTVTLRADQLTGALGRDLAKGAVVGSVSATSTTGVGSGDERAIFDGDFAWSTGRSYTIGE